MSLALNAQSLSYAFKHLGIDNGLSQSTAYDLIQDDSGILWIATQEGLNRFVWNMRHSMMPGVPDTYIETSYRGHKVAPGTYSLELKVGDNTVTTEAVIIENPQYKTAPGQYESYHTFMKEMEMALTEMHTKVNILFNAKKQLKAMMTRLKKKAGHKTLIKEGEDLIKQITTWDEEMVQRKSKAYDDVENFPNKFTAEYMFLINQTESSIPRVNKANRDRKAELDAQWKPLQAKANIFIKSKIKVFNNKLWDAGIGAIQMD